MVTELVAETRGSNARKWNNTSARSGRARVVAPRGLIGCPVRYVAMRTNRSI